MDNINYEEILKKYWGYDTFRGMQKEAIKAVVEEKKVTDYNMYLAYRLYELKKTKPAEKTNKELFNQAVAEWKELKKNVTELKKTMELAKEFANKK